VEQVIRCYSIFLFFFSERNYPSPINKLLDAIFSIQFREILKRSEFNILALLSCGAVITHDSSKKAIVDFAKRFVNMFILECVF
jgi:hypothetical protein